MKKKTVFGAVLLAVLVLQAQTVFAASNSEDFINAAKRNDLKRMEQIIQRNANRMDLDYCMAALVRYESINDSTMIAAFRLLFSYGANINSKRYDPLLFSVVIYRPMSYEIIRFLLNAGANPDTNNGTPFITVLRNRNLELAALMLQKGADIDLRQSIGDVDRVALRWVSESQEGTPLMIMARDGYFAGVKFLVENGAKINLRDSLGRTAASIAYDKGEIEIYNYLKEHGAIDFEPRQVTQPAAPPANTTVYVQPSAPAQATPSEPERNVGREIADAFKSPLQSGTYSLAGTQAKIRLTSIAKSGIFTYTNRQGGTGTGSYSIDGNRMTIQMEGYTFVYTVTSETSFSGNDETWVRTGF